MHNLKTLLSGFLSGILIGLGCIVYLSEMNDSRFFGALLFGLGLFTIIHFKLFLFTGKIGFVLDNKPKYLLDLLIGLIGNFIGAIFLGLIMRVTRMIDVIGPNAINLVDAKEGDTWYSVLFLSFLCGIMIYLAVKGHEICPYPIGKFAFVFFAIVIFILCGFEHCVANMFYYTVAGEVSWHAALGFLLMIVGNSAGSIFVNELYKLIKKIDKSSE